MTPNERKAALEAPMTEYANAISTKKAPVTWSTAHEIALRESGFKTDEELASERKKKPKTSKDQPVGIFQLKPSNIKDFQERNELYMPYFSKIPDSLINQVQQEEAR